MENEIDYEAPSSKRARASYMALCAFAYLVDLTASGVFLSKLLIRLGVSDAWNGVISSLLSLAYLTQLVSIFLLRKKISYKKISIIFEISGLAIFGVLFLLPISGLPKSILQVAAVILILFAYMSRYLVSGICYRWANEFVHPRKRGIYSAWKECYSLLAGAAYSLAIGFMFDKFEAASKALEEAGKIAEATAKMDTAFTIFALLSFLFAAINLFLYSRIPDADFSVSGERSAKGILKSTFGNPRFRPVLLMTILFEVGRYFTFGFMNTFQTEDLGLTLFNVQLINTGAYLIRFVVTPFFGKLTDRTSFSKCIEIALYAVIASFFCVIFISPGTWTWIFVIFWSILYQVGLGGIEQNFFNISYAYVPRDYLTEAMAIRSSVGGTFGFLGSLVAGSLFDMIRDNGLFGLQIRPQQALAIISCLFLTAGALYTHFRVCKIPVEKK